MHGPKNGIYLLVWNLGGKQKTKREIKKLAFPFKKIERYVIRSHVELERFGDDVSLL